MSDQTTGPHALDNACCYRETCRARIDEIERLRAALREIAAGSYPVPLNEDVDKWRALAAKRKDIAWKALSHV